MKGLNVMNNLDAKLQDRLTKLAYKLTVPFCLGCYAEARAGRCSLCFSDDLARLRIGDSVGWGVDWVIESLIRENLKPVDLAEAFEESVREIYPESVRAAWMELDVVTVCKEVDPVSWDLALSEYVGQEESEGLIVSFDHGATHFYASDIERYLDEEESKDVNYCDEAIQVFVE